ncbi:hypothetical protein AAG570_014168 [Ranatra chinensis]|uniref:Pyrroline-5-carboxylate reductase n=1 Tax=Ranatra chinensis TaxID=642074 RepID=A0ABD0Y5J9_9HEMI
MFKLGFIGSGNMAGALIKGIIDSKLYDPSEIAVGDPSQIKLNEMLNMYGVGTYSDNDSLVRNCETIVLAIKPQIVEPVLKKLSFSDSKLFISILSGITTKTLENLLPAKTRVIRAMPNMPALVHKACTVIAAGAHTDTCDMQLAKEIFESVGVVDTVDESEINAIAAISGSGPAYFYLILEAMADAGVQAGLNREFALKLAAHTAIGSARMVLETGEHPAALKDMVTSPGGTTIDALYEFEKGSLRYTIMTGVKAAVLKAYNS